MMPRMHAPQVHPQCKAGLSSPLRSNSGGARSPVQQAAGLGQLQAAVHRPSVRRQPPRRPVAARDTGCQRLPHAPAQCQGVLTRYIAMQQCFYMQAAQELGQVGLQVEPAQALQLLQPASRSAGKRESWFRPGCAYAREGTGKKRSRWRL
jgi:hypothetical protein